MLNQLQPVFACLQKHDVRYVVIGGIAAVLYGVPRATFDLDILIEASEENARRLLQAFQEAGLGTAMLIDAPGLLANEITVFKDVVRIDVQTSTPGLVFSQAWERKKVVHFHGQELLLVDLQDLIAAKRGAGRKIDLEDIAQLENLLPQP